MRCRRGIWPPSNSDNSRMNPSQSYHQEAMRKAEEAEVARRAGDRSRALQLFSTAYFLERLAADAYHDRRELEPTRSVFYQRARRRWPYRHAASTMPKRRLSSALAETCGSNRVGTAGTEGHGRCAQSANWTGAIRDLKSLLFSRARKLRRGNVLAMELSRVALEYGRRADRGLLAVRIPRDSAAQSRERQCGPC